MKSILIIGASSSLGGLVVKTFAESGHNILGTYAKSLPNIESEDNINFAHLDLTSQESITNFSADIALKKKAFDTCIFLAGHLPGKKIEDYNNLEIDEVMTINFSGFTKVYKQILLNFNNNSQVIIVSSVSAQGGSYDPIYAASKGALISFMKSLSQVSPLKIRANAIAPGLILNTSMYNDMDPSRQAFHIKQSPTRKLTTPEDLSRIILDISKPHWSNMNGAVVQINGGSYV
tara:strand:- start:172 stop:870 length:699 start_codon:yes stop_codon:yes gene_type:complete